MLVLCGTCEWGAKHKEMVKKSLPYEGGGRLSSIFFVAGICAAIKHRCVTHLYCYSLIQISLPLETYVNSILLILSIEVAKRERKST